MIKIGIIGGSGLEKTNLIQSTVKREIETKWGMPSSPLLEGVFGNIQVAFLSRHGYDHTISPTHVNNRANITALKELGCTHIISSTAVGSLREEIAPGHLVVPDQFIDFTKFRANTFYDNFENGVQHLNIADPFTEDLRQALIATCEKLGFVHHKKATIVTIEGPRFSTRAESHMFRMLGADIINMSIAPEAILAREAGIDYATIAMSTDYDCWRENTETVTWEQVSRVMAENSQKVQEVFAEVIPYLVAHCR